MGLFEHSQRLVVLGGPQFRMMIEDLDRSWEEINECLQFVGEFVREEFKGQEAVLAEWELIRSVYPPTDPSPESGPRKTA